MEIIYRNKSMFLGKDGAPRIFVNWKQAKRAVSKLAEIGIESFAFQDFRSMRFMVKIVNEQVQE